MSNLVAMPPLPDYGLKEAVKDNVWYEKNLYSQQVMHAWTWPKMNGCLLYVSLPGLQAIDWIRVACVCVVWRCSGVT